MTTLSLASMLVKEGRAAIYSAALTIARNLGVPVDSWQVGDPTRSLYHVEAQKLDQLEDIVIGYAESNFLDDADGFWLKYGALQRYGVVVPEATYATTDVTLTNASGAVYPLDPGDLIVKNTTTGKTYRSTTGGTLSALGGTLDVTVVAEEAGSDSSAGAGEIDDLVTGLLGVTCTNDEAAIGVDEQDPEETRAQCRRKLSSISPNGPRGIYEYVALTPALTGTSGITRAREYGDSDTGDVTLYVAGPSGTASEPDRVLVETAEATYATPLTITLTVLSSSAVTVNVAYTLWVYTSVNKTEVEIATEVGGALEQMVASLAIGGDIIPPATTGSLFKSLIESTILGVYEEGFRVTVATPAADTALTNGQTVALGTVTPTIHLVTR